MIEADVIKNKTIEKLKDDHVFLLNNVESTLHDNPMEKDMEKSKYEQIFSECKK